MINYQSKKPSKNFLMIEKEIYDDLTMEAFFLFFKLRTLAPNESNSNQSLMQKTRLGKRKFDRAKKELVFKGYLDTKQLYDNVYAFYIGKEAVQSYKRSKIKKDNRYEHNAMKKLNKKYADGSKM